MPTPACKSKARQELGHRPAMRWGVLKRHSRVLSGNSWGTLGYSRGAQGVLDGALEGVLSSLRLAGGAAAASVGGTVAQPWRRAPLPTASSSSYWDLPLPTAASSSYRDVDQQVGDIMRAPLFRPDAGGSFYSPPVRADSRSPPPGRKSPAFPSSLRLPTGGQSPEAEPSLHPLQPLRRSPEPSFHPSQPLHRLPPEAGSRQAYSYWM